jgi:hypothetical protein
MALGVLLAAMAFGQVSDVWGFAHVLAAYRVLPLVRVAAVVLIGSEAVAATLLLRPQWPARRTGAALALGVAATWTALGVQAFARVIPAHNCGCFGVHFAQPLRWWVLAEDAEFLALAWWVWRSLRGARPASQAQTVEERSPGSPTRSRQRY